MRLIGLSIIAATLFAGAASAQDRVNMLEFVHEPQGQAFTPPPIRIEQIRGSNPENAVELGNRAKSECAAWVAEVYSYRDRIYVACLREKLEPAGLRIIVLNDENEVARRFGVATN